MVSLDDALIIRLEKAGERFELFADPNKVYDYKKGKELSLNDVLAAFEVFKDGRKGETQSDDALKKAFGTIDFDSVAKEILNRGEISLTTEQKRKFLEEKRNRIITHISRNYINPQNGAPHPPKRVELAMDEAKITIDPNKSAEGQIEDIIKKLRIIIPLRYEVIKVAIKVPPEYAGKCYGALKEYSIKREEWLSDGSLVVMLEISPGLESVLYDKINGITHGNVQTKRVER
ncbi:MAG: ribosome assembly factor SBDS [Bacteroidales bacterium]|jgi:ribosome maturation protein SDO1|nr:ribosome assembly factor SBDS [Bacteroidales bacterium]